MADWISFLIFAGLFYVVMRYGCGAHMIHGHHGKHKKSKKDIDPVCGMNVEVDKGYGKMYKSTLYRFCSRKCLDQFEADPDKYTEKSTTHGGEK